MALSEDAHEEGPGRRGQRRNSCKRSAHRSLVKVGSIIPCLPDDVALCILARLPRSLQNRRKLICHSWRDAMEPARMTSIRKALNISEVWPLFVSDRSYVYKDSEFLFTIVDPIRRRRRNIPLPSWLLQHRRRFYISVMGGMGSKVLIAALARVPFGSGRNEGLELMQGVYSFDGLSMKWEDSLYAPLPTTLDPTLHNDRRTIAVDTDGGYVYVAGGIRQSWGDAIQGAERLDIKTKRWETLPDLHVKRASAVGVVMGGHFYMIGGCCDFVEISRGTIKYTSLKSGEIWDPASREWTLVPELWPGELFQDRPEGRVVALGDRLYALRSVMMTETLAEELMSYESASKTWMSMGFVPLDVADQYCHDTGGVNLLKMGEELWVIYWRKWMCVAAKPTFSLPLCWRTLPRTFKRALPIHYYANMVGELNV